MSGGAERPGGDELRNADTQHLGVLLQHQPLQGGYWTLGLLVQTVVEGARLVSGRMWVRAFSQLLFSFSSVKFG